MFYNHDNHWGMVGGEGRGRSYVTPRRNWPCVLSCEGYVGGGGLRQMLGVVLEAVAPEPDLPMCPLMGHMEGHCCHPVPHIL